MTGIDAVLAAPPEVHLDETDGVVRGFNLLEDVARWIFDTATGGDQTLETGSGLSTVAFALAGTHHTTVMPYEHEVERLREYCAGRDISLERVRFEIKRSEDVLPTLDLPALDLVLIDGSHSFPQPFIDWFYTAQAVRIGGTVIVDDTFVWTGRALRDFMDAEPEWEIAYEWYGRTVAFRKMAELDQDKLWTRQPYVMRHSRLGRLGRARTILDMTRAGDWDELRSRARKRLRAT